MTLLDCPNCACYEVKKIKRSLLFKIFTLGIFKKYKCVQCKMVFHSTKNVKSVKKRRIRQLKAI